MRWEAKKAKPRLKTNFYSDADTDANADADAGRPRKILIQFLFNSQSEDEAGSEYEERSNWQIVDYRFVLLAPL